MIYGSHVVLSSSDPDADRAFLAELRGRRGAVGSITKVRFPSGGEVGLDEPRHAAMVEPR